MVKKTVNSEEWTVQSIVGSGKRSGGSKKVLALLLFTVHCTLSTAFPQQPQAQAGQPIYSVNAKYVNGVAPGYWPTAGSGLALNISSGTVNCKSSMVTYAGGTLTMTAGVTSYVYLDTTNNCAPAANTTGFTSTTIPIATVVAGATAITSVTDDRTPFSSSGASGGGNGLGNGSTVLDATQFSGADFGTTLSNALSAIYAAGGGTVDARGFNCVSASCVIGTANLIIGDGTHAVRVHLPAGTVTRNTVSSTGHSAQVFYNSLATIIAPGTTLSGPSDVTAFQQATGGGISNVHVEGLNVADNGTVTSGSVAFQIGGPTGGLPTYVPANVTYSGSLMWLVNTAHGGYGAHFAIYNKALSASQIANHYSVGSTSGSSYESTVEADGPLSYWPLTETSGSTATDVVAGRNGTYSGSYTLASQTGIPGQSGSHAPLFGASGYVQLPNYAWFPAGDFTLEGWLWMLDAPGPQWGPIGFTLPSGWGTDDVIVNEWSSGWGASWFYVDLNGNRLNSNWPQVGFSRGSWGHFAWTVHNGLSQVYINGTAVVSGSDVLYSTFKNISGSGADIGIQLNSQHGCVCYNEIDNPTASGASIGFQTVNNSGYGYGVNQNQVYGGVFRGPIGVKDAGGILNTFYSPDLENNSTNYMQLLGSSTTVISPYEEAGGGDYLCGGYNAVLGALGYTNGSSYGPTFCTNPSSGYGGPATDFVFGSGVTPGSLGVKNYIAFGTTAPFDVGTQGGTVNLFADGPQWNQYSGRIYGAWGHSVWKMGIAEPFSGMNEHGKVTMGAISNPPAPTATVSGTPGSNSAKYELVAYDVNGGQTAPSGWSNTLTNVPSPLSSSNEVCLTWAATDGLGNYDIIKDDITNSQIGSIATVQNPSVPVGSSSPPTLTFCDTGQSVNTSYSIPTRNSTADVYLSSSTTYTANNVSLNGWAGGSTNVTFGDYLYLDATSTDQNRLVFFYNTPKTAYPQPIYQLFNNSTDRQALLTIVGKGSSGSYTPTCYVNGVCTLNNTLDDGSGNMTAGASVSAGTSVNGPQFCLAGSCITSWPSGGGGGGANTTLSNLSTTSINLSTLTFTGAAGITAGGTSNIILTSASTGQGTTGVVNINATGSANNLNILNLFAPNLPSGDEMWFNLGSAGSANNAISIGFYNAGSGSSNNRFDFTMWAGTTALSLYSNGKVSTHNSTVDDGSGNLTAGGNVAAGSGTNVVYRCTTAGTLPVGALTVASGNCGASTDTGLRVK